MYPEYYDMLKKKIEKRRELSVLYYSKLEVGEKLQEEIEELQVKIEELDSEIAVLSPDKK